MNRPSSCPSLAQQSIRTLAQQSIKKRQQAGLGWSPGHAAVKGRAQTLLKPRFGFQMPVPNLRNRPPWRDTDTRAWAGEAADKPEISVYGQYKRLRVTGHVRSERIKNQAPSGAHTYFFERPS